MTQQNDLGAIQVSGHEMALADEIEAAVKAIIEFADSDHTPPRIAGYVTERIWHIANLAALLLAQHGAGATTNEEA
jgi:hypothetical protein